MNEETYQVNSVTKRKLEEVLRRLENRKATIPDGIHSEIKKMGGIFKIKIGVYV